MQDGSTTLTDPAHRIPEPVEGAVISKIDAGRFDYAHRSCPGSLSLPKGDYCGGDSFDDAGFL